MTFLGGGKIIEEGCALVPPRQFIRTSGGSWGGLGGVLGSLGGVLGASWGVLGASWGGLGVLGGSWALLGGSWAPLGGVLGWSWRLGVVLGRLW